MKRLTILTIIAVTTIAMSGCSRSRSLFRWNQGGPCDSCSSGSSIGPYEQGPMMYEGNLLPPPSVMPGPAPPSGN